MKFGSLEATTNSRSLQLKSQRSETRRASNSYEMRIRAPMHVLPASAAIPQLGLALKHFGGSATASKTQTLPPASMKARFTTRATTPLGASNEPVCAMAPAQPVRRTKQLLRIRHHWQCPIAHPTLKCVQQRNRLLHYFFSVTYDFARAHHRVRLTYLHGGLY
jgi:hypothetical protein